MLIHTIHGVEGVSFTGYVWGAGQDCFCWDPRLSIASGLPGVNIQNLNILLLQVVTGWALSAEGKSVYRFLLTLAVLRSHCICSFWSKLGTCEFGQETTSLSAAVQCALALY